MLTIILGRGLQFLLALATMKMATTLLSPEEMGKVSLTLSTIAFFALFLINPVGMFINRRLHSWYVTGVAKHYLIRYLNYLFIVAILAAISLLITNHFALVHFGMNIGWLVFLVSTSLIFNTINQTSIPSLNLLGDVKAFILLTIATLLASFIIATIIVNQYDFTAPYWLLGIVLGQIIFAVFGTRILFRQLDQFKGTLKHKITKKQLITLSSFCWPVAIAAAFFWVQIQGYRYVFESQLGFGALGLFVAGYSVSAGIIAGFESVLTTYFQPRFYRDIQIDDKNAQTNSWLSYSRAVIPSLIITVIFVALVAPELTFFFLGGRFHSSESYVVWGAFGEAARVLVSVYSMKAYAEMRTNLLIIPYFLGALSSITLTLILIPLYGSLGVGLALVLSGYLMLFSINFLLRVNIRELINFKIIIQSILSLVILGLISITIRSFFNSRSWSEVLTMLSVIGFLYLSIVYFVIKSHLMDKKI